MYLRLTKAGSAYVRVVLGRWINFTQAASFTDMRRPPPSVPSRSNYNDTPANVYRVVMELILFRCSAVGQHQGEGGNRIAGQRKGDLLTGMDDAQIHSFSRIGKDPTVVAWSLSMTDGSILQSGQCHALRHFPGICSETAGAIASGSDAPGVRQAGRPQS